MNIRFSDFCQDRILRSKEERYEHGLLKLQVDRDAFSLGEAFKHPFEGVFPAKPALLESAIRLARNYTHSLVDLHPSRFNTMSRAKRLSDIVRPDKGGPAVMTLIRHADSLFLLFPRNGNQHRPEDLLP